MGKTLLVKDIQLLATMDDARREIRGGALFIDDGVIAAAGAEVDMPDRPADEVLRLPDHIVIPGLINTHHHMYQTLTRCIAQDRELFAWLKTLYPIWARMHAADVAVSAKLAMAELLLSGCTTSSDHLYIFPNDCTLDDTIQAAQTMGMRFHAARGSMSVGERDGGLPPDSVVEAEEQILKDTQRLIETYHDPGRFAVLRIVVAPCSPFSVSQALMRESAALARAYGVRLHTHLAENSNDVAYSLEKFGVLPGDYAREVNWVGEDVWHAHCVCLNEREIGIFARTGTGVCHCPSSNMRLASGIAPVRRMLDSGVKVGLGVDGSASNDSGHLLEEARHAMLLQRVSGNPAGLSAREALALATRGSAAVLGRDDIGQLAPGMAADFAAYRLDQLGYAGGLHDPLAALLFCRPQNADLVMVQGKMVVKDGQLLTVDAPALIAEHNRRSLALVRGE
ncbi:MAG TPA: 8-oxoguanine deaminase [Candidatus Limnocylindrales bacterium]|nr:8-oxoguanine deaminase [Candidatus Limnocylindrales bacterium]